MVIIKNLPFPKQSVLGVKKKIFCNTFATSQVTGNNNTNLLTPYSMILY